MKHLSLTCSPFRLFNSVVPPTRLPLTADYYLFKELGKAPQYESFPKGGVWSFNLPKKGQGALVDPNDKKRLEDTWLNLVGGWIGTGAAAVGRSGRAGEADGCGWLGHGVVRVGDVDDW